MGNPGEQTGLTRIARISANSNVLKGLWILARGKQICERHPGETIPKKFQNPIRATESSTTACRAVAGRRRNGHGSRNAGRIETAKYAEHANNFFI
jgi:hypothetical protein